MKNSNALIPTLILTSNNKVSLEIAAALLGVGMLALLAQIYMPLPFTPVPITGQTFGVALISLLWGSRRGVQVVSCYLLLGSLGFPIFAHSASGMIWGPTSGYLLGMLMASYFMGTLSDRGWLETRFKSWLVAQVGSLIVFAIGLVGLSFFLPSEKLLAAGMIPFIPGDLIKTALASSIAFQVRKNFHSKQSEI